MVSLVEEYCKSPQALQESSAVLSSAAPPPLTSSLQKVARMRQSASISHDTHVLTCNKRYILPVQFVSLWIYLSSSKRGHWKPLYVCPSSANCLLIADTTHEGMAFLMFLPSIPYAQRTTCLYAVYRNCLWWRLGHNYIRSYHVFIVNNSNGKYCMSCWLIFYCTTQHQSCFYSKYMETTEFKNLLNRIYYFGVEKLVL